MSAEFLTVSEVCAKLPGCRGARRVCPSTVTRWILNGCPARSGVRVKLAATRCGIRWLVRPEDLDAFFAALAGETAPEPAKPRPPAARQKAVARAAAQLEAAGA